VASERVADLVRVLLALAAELPHCDDHRPEGVEA
jgi:hypothetical protein